MPRTLVFPCLEELGLALCTLEFLRGQVIPFIQFHPPNYLLTKLLHGTTWTLARTYLKCAIFQISALFISTTISSLK
jgi:hypothetical protein